LTRRLLALLCCLWFAPGASVRAAPPSLDDVKAAHPASESRLFDRHGALLHEVRTDLSRRRGQWIAFGDISPRLRESVIALEDRRFLTHRGIDWLALAAAARDTLLGRTRGASTITMQVAAQLDPALRAPARRSLRQKWRQLLAARALDAAWRKQEILEAYLNLATYRGELQGIDSAARALLGKSAMGLDAHEALLLALLLRSPNSTPAAVAARGCRLAPVLPQPMDCARLTRIADAALRTPPGLRAAASMAPHAARRLLKTGTGNVTSTLVADVQRFALDSLQKQLRQLASRNVRDGAVLAVDNVTGEVLAYVGNGGALSSAHHVDGVRALRQAGSTLKPFLYALAVEQKLLTAASLLEDSPVNLSTPTGLYVPQNYDHAFRGLVSLRNSLAGSLNVPAVRTLMLLGPDRLLERLRLLGFGDLDRDGDYYGYALALGSPEVTLWQLVEAYRSLARGGHRGPLRLGRDDASAAVSAPVGPALLREGASFIIGDILADRDSRSRAFGVDNPLNLPFWAAVKTGTSKQMRDNWCIGYTPRYTVGVWVGNFDGAPMWEVSGLTGAAPVWAEVMRALHAGDPPTPPAAPSGVERKPIGFEPGLEAPREEWFIAGTAGDRPGLRRPAATAPRIAYPGPDSVLVVDRDIPPAAQRVIWTMRPARDDLRWQLNGLPLADDSWQPRPGSYKLELVDDARRVLDVVQFTVRGAVAPNTSSAAGKGAGIGGSDQAR
jgi:penicillin-binding protein 1C